MTLKERKIYININNNLNKNDLVKFVTSQFCYYIEILLAFRERDGDSGEIFL